MSAFLRNCFQKLMNFDLKSCSVLIAIYNALSSTTMCMFIDNLVIKRFNCLGIEWESMWSDFTGFYICNIFFFLKVRYCLHDEHDI